MIKSIFLFTTRQTMVFDETGKQVIDVQQAIGWGTNEDYSHKEREVLRMIIAQKPEIYLTQWNKDYSQKMKINIEEFCCLLGHGKWYWDTYKETKGEESEVENETDNKRKLSGNGIS